MYHTNSETVEHPSLVEQSESSVSQLNSIQLLRGAAAFLVVGYHLSLFAETHYKNVKVISQLFGQGYAGVDLFFVISGFVITYSTFIKSKQPPALLNYVSRRLIRVFPIYWGMVVIFWITCRVTGGNVPEAGRPLRDWLIAAFLTPLHMTIIPVSWSLSHELFFYLLIGLLLYSRKMWVVLVSVLAGTIYHLATTQSQMPSLWFMFSPYNINFLGGVVVAFLHARKPFHTWVYWALLFSSVVWLFVGPEASSGNTQNRLFLYGLSSIGLILALTGLESSRQIYISRSFTKLGDASYVIYLLHPSALVLLYSFVDKHASLPFWAFACLGVLLFFGVAVVSILIHTYLEKPLLRQLNKLIFPH